MDKDLQKMLKSKLQKGPQLQLEPEKKIGINTMSGDTDNIAFFELWGRSQVFRLYIVNPSAPLYTTKYIGNGQLLWLLLDDEETRGGFISIKDKIMEQLMDVFPYLHTDDIEELTYLWEHYLRPKYIHPVKEEK